MLRFVGTRVTRSNNGNSGVVLALDLHSIVPHKDVGMVVYDSFETLIIHQTIARLIRTRPPSILLKRVPKFYQHIRPNTGNYAALGTRAVLAAPNCTQVMLLPLCRYNRLPGYTDVSAHMETILLHTAIGYVRQAR